MSTVNGEFAINQICFVIFFKNGYRKMQVYPACDYLYPSFGYTIRGSNSLKKDLGVNAFSIRRGTGTTLKDFGQILIFCRVLRETGRHITHSKSEQRWTHRTHL